MFAVGASRVAFVKGERRGEILVGFVERKDAEALRPGHGEIGEDEILAVGEAVVVRERFGDFGESTCATLLERLGDLVMQDLPARPVSRL